RPPRADLAPRRRLALLRPTPRSRHRRRAHPPCRRHSHPQPQAARPAQVRIHDTLRVLRRTVPLRSRVANRTQVACLCNHARAACAPSALEPKILRVTHTHAPPALPARASSRGSVCVFSELVISGSVVSEVWRIGASPDAPNVHTEWHESATLVVSSGASAVAATTRGRGGLSCSSCASNSATLSRYCIGARREGWRVSTSLRSTNRLIAVCCSRRVKPVS